MVIASMMQLYHLVWNEKETTKYVKRIKSDFLYPGFLMIAACVMTLEVNIHILIHQITIIILVFMNIIFPIIIFMVVIFTIIIFTIMRHV